VDGVAPLPLLPGVTRHPRYLYVFKYRPAAFGGLPKTRFLDALVAEGVPAMPGYPPLHAMPAIRRAFQERDLRLRAGAEGEGLPHTDRAWADEGIWLPQNVLLGGEDDVEDICAAIDKVARGARMLA
jgi:dTDP-4-amino-4,6-dideoxygalactose transaminase